MQEHFVWGSFFYIVNLDLNLRAALFKIQKSIFRFCNRRCEHATSAKTQKHKKYEALTTAYTDAVPVPQPHRLGPGVSDGPFGVFYLGGKATISIKSRGYVCFAGIGNRLMKNCKYNIISTTNLAIWDRQIYPALIGLGLGSTAAYLLLALLLLSRLRLITAEAEEKTIHSSEKAILYLTTFSALFTNSAYSSSISMSYQASKRLWMS